MGNACPILTVCSNNGSTRCISRSHSKAIKPKPTVIRVKPATTDMGTGPSRTQAPEVIRVTSPPPSQDEVVPFVESTEEPVAPRTEENSNHAAVVTEINSLPRPKPTETPLVSMSGNIQSVPNNDLISDLDSLLEEDEPRPQTQPQPHLYQRPNSALRHSNNRTSESQRLVIDPPLEISRLTLRTNRLNQNSVTTHDIQAETENEWNFKKESLDGFDPSKFKIVNSQRKAWIPTSAIRHAQGNTLKKMSGDYGSQEEPSLLWRLGLVSPADAFSSHTTYVETRTTLPKPPSYDPMDEQLMAMIEKEYA